MRSAWETPLPFNRQGLVRRGQRLEYFTVAWNSVEALISIAAAVIAGAVALTGFGRDSIIEVVSGAALLHDGAGDQTVLPFGMSCAKASIPRRNGNEHRRSSHLDLSELVSFSHD